MSQPAVQPEVRAAGGVVWRRGEHGQPELLLIHRPRYDDWTFPKGKADPGESDEDCARREVLEETGLVCALGPPVSDTTYLDRSGRIKIVHYWAMTVIDERPFVANDEVDEVQWLTQEVAAALLTYPRDAGVLGEFFGGPATLLS